MPDSIPSVVQQIVHLYAHDLAHVKFGDLDGRVLDEGAARVAAHAEAVARAEAALEAARGELAESQELLLGRAQRALAYARVYAEDDADLSARLDALVLPRGAARRASTASVVSSVSADSSAPRELAPVRRRARRTDHAAASPPLFETQGAPAHGTAALLEQ